MTVRSLKLHPNGSVTLPKAWREQFPTQHFIAFVRPDGLLIKPLLDVVEYEEENGSFGLRFPMGVHVEDLLATVRSANRTLDRKRAPRRRTRG